MAVESGVPVAMEPAEQPDVLPSAAISEPRDVPCLIIGGGPAGLAAAYELAKLGEKVLIVDDKDRLGGKLVLQTHTQSALLSVIWGSETAPPEPLIARNGGQQVVSPCTAATRAPEACTFWNMLTCLSC